MEYISVNEAALQRSISVRRIQQMCKSGKIPGAIKKGRSWMIPTGEEKDTPAKVKKLLPIGISDFRMAVEEYYYVDKTLLIRDFLDNRPMVSLFTRPRRFGKTLNIDMLRVFLKRQKKIHLYILKIKRSGSVEKEIHLIKENIQ